MMTMTRRGTVLLALLMASAAGVAQTVVTQGNAKDDLFAGTEQFEKNAVNVTEITQGPKSLDLVNGRDESRAHRTILNVVRTYSYEKPGMFNMADVDVYRKRLETGGWECSVHTRDLRSGSSTDVCDKPRADGLKESAIISISPRSLTFIHTIRKPEPGDQSSLDSLGTTFILRGPDLAMLDGRMAEIQARTRALSGTFGDANLGDKKGFVIDTGDGHGPIRILKKDSAPGVDRDIIIDTDIHPAAPGHPLRMKVVRPDESASGPIPAPAAAAPAAGAPALLPLRPAAPAAPAPQP
jgi:hypothetical protein